MIRRNPPDLIPGMDAVVEEGKIMEKSSPRARRFPVVIAITITIIVLNLLLVTGVFGLSYEPFLWQRFISGYDTPSEFVYLPVVIKNSSPTFLQAPGAASIAPVDFLAESGGP